MSKTRRFVLFHLPVILYSMAVITLSSIPHLKPPPIRLLATDKVLHFIEYGIFALLAFRSFTRIGSVSQVNRALLGSAVFICIFAVLDEYYQRFVPGRHFDVYDILTDVGGAILVLLFLWLRSRRKQHLSA